MRNRSDEPFIPPVCPAIKSDVKDPPAEARLGFTVQPEDLLMSMDGLDANGNLAMGPLPAVKTLTGAWFSLISGEMHAYLVSEEYPIGTPEDALLDAVAQDPDAERKIGERYCERIKDCKGDFTRDGETVCQALDPKDFISELKKLYPDA